MTGFLAVNKPSGPTSHDIVDRLRRLTGEKRIGHAGTLDPFASGVLLVGVGREATREFSKLSGLDKRYRAVLRLGATSDTDDRTGVIRHCERQPCLPAGKEATPSADDEIASSAPGLLAMTDIEAVLKKFTGKIEQIPPMYSAKKIGGQKLYKLARAGQTVERRPSSVEVYSIALISGSPKEGSLTVDVHCSSGTYIRALARDIGQALGCGAYLQELERTAVGPFGLDEATPLSELNPADIQERLISPKTVLARCQRR